ncbi:MAG: hypothetical protein ACLR9W_08370 [Enterobacter hormaechei]
MDDDFSPGSAVPVIACLRIERRNRHVWRRKIDGKVGSAETDRSGCLPHRFPQGNRVCAFCQWLVGVMLRTFGRTVVVPITTPLS